MRGEKKSSDGTSTSTELYDDQSAHVATQISSAPRADVHVLVRQPGLR